MTPRLSKNLVDELKPQAKDYFVWDDKVKGFGVRVKPSGTRSYIVQYRTRRGKARRFTIGKHGTISTKDARKRALQLLSEVLFGTDPVERAKEIREAYSFRDLAEEYLERRKDEKIIGEDERILRKDIIPHLGSILATDVCKRDIVAVLDRIQNRGSSVMANRCLSLLKRLFGFGIARDILEENPARGIRPTREISRARILSAKEIRTFWHRIDDMPSSDFLKSALRLCLTTGQRPGEVISVEWMEIDFKEKIWNLPAEKTKNRLPHSVPISTLALDLLKRIPNEGRYVFPGRKGQASVADTHLRVSALSNALRKNRDILAVEPFTAHDLRRTAASGLAALGVSRLVVSKILNHKERGITGVYDRYAYEKEKRDALEKWAKKIISIVEGKTADVIPLVK